MADQLRMLLDEGTKRESKVTTFSRFFSPLSRVIIKNLEGKNGMESS